eukprot:TRINITY_DN10356_c0_g1_i1.p1 TRINITY_DN10356_c0_g1~~TRINITY_DN10356_c0_g1_i1.p1  ORF type:complete len:469 (-),score=57.86 TRINITY_DN10356_c0_g1_i1:24-1430(-)
MHRNEAILFSVLLISACCEFTQITSSDPLIRLWVFQLPWTRIAALPFLAFQYATDGPRWQLYPAYIALCVTNMVLFTVLTLLSIFLAYVLPVTRFPPLTGPYKKLGTKIFNFTDKSRSDWNQSPSGNRRLVAQVWYPGKEKSSSELAPYIHPFRLLGPAICSQFRIPSFAISHFQNVMSRSYFDLHVDDVAKSKPFPIIIFSHGYSGTRIQNTLLCEEMASRGYIVVAPDHTYDCCCTVFEDGQIAPFKAGATPELIKNPNALREFRRAQLDIRAQDISFLINQIELLNKTDSMFSGTMDTACIGIMGHSFGGATSIVASFRDKRISACLSLDGWMWPIAEDIMSTGSPCPIAHIQAERFFSETQPFTKDNRMQVDNLHKSTKASSYVTTVRAVSHYDFSDMSFFAPILLRFLGLSGKNTGYEFQLFMVKTCDNFFEHHLRNKSTLSLGTKLTSNVPPKIEYRFTYNP